jgi:hypothetical protein
MYSDAVDSDDVAHEGVGQPGQTAEVGQGIRAIEKADSARGQLNDVDRVEALRGAEADDLTENVDRDEVDEVVESTKGVGELPRTTDQCVDGLTGTFLPKLLTPVHVLRFKGVDRIGGRVRCHLLACRPERDAIILLELITEPREVLPLRCACQRFGQLHSVGIDLGGARQLQASSDHS